MSNAAVYVVKPTLPTVLGDREYLPYVDHGLIQLVVEYYFFAHGTLSSELKL
jgi:hypothetical protein